MTHIVRRAGDLKLLDHVPAEVCPVCGDTLFTPDTVRAMERILASPPEPVASAPVYEFSMC